MSEGWKMQGGKNPVGVSLSRFGNEFVSCNEVCNGLRGARESFC